MQNKKKTRVKGLNQNKNIGTVKQTKGVVIVIAKCGTYSFNLVYS